MYGYPDVTPNAKDKKRRKQQEYQAALDRDAGKAVGTQQGQLPQVGAKYKQQQGPNKQRENAMMMPRPGPITMEDVMDKLNQFSYYMQSNDNRIRDLENTIAVLESQSDVNRNLPPGTGASGGNVSDNKEARKLKLRVDELQTILAAEIKSRNASERELEQQIMSARENMNQSDGDANNGNHGGLQKKISELSDKLHRAEAALQMETTERLELQKQVDGITSHDNTLSSQLKKVQTDLEKEAFLNKVAADERKRQMELIRDAESKIVESKERLAEADHKRIENQKESRNQIDILERKMSEQADSFNQLIIDKTIYIDNVAADMRIDQEKSVKDMESHINKFEAKFDIVEKNLHSALNESLRSLHTDLRIERENAEANHQEMKEVLSAEITSRRMAVEKSNSKIDKLYTKQEEIIQSMQKIKANLDQSVKDIDASLCKIAGGFSEQLITLQDVTKTAVRTLQIDQVSLTAKLKNAVTEYKQLHKLLENRADECDKHISSVQLSLKSECKKNTTRIDEVDGKLEEKCAELNGVIEAESKKREDSSRKLTEIIKNNYDTSLNQMNELECRIDIKINDEASCRSNAIISSEKRVQESLQKQSESIDDKMIIFKETLDNELSYAISVENQTRCLASQKLSKMIHSQMKLLSDTTMQLVENETKERNSDLLKTKEILQSYESNFHNFTGELEGKHLDMVEAFRHEVDEKDLCAKLSKRRWQRKFARESKALVQKDNYLENLVMIHEENRLSDMRRLEEKFSSGIADCDETLVTEITDVRKTLKESSSDVLLEVDRKEVELLQRLKVELMEQLLANHVRAKSQRAIVEKSINSLEVKNCLDSMVNTVVEENILESVTAKFEAVKVSATTDTSEVKSYVDMATKFLDKKLMAGFEDYNKRLTTRISDIRKDVNNVSADVLQQVEKNDGDLLDQLKKMHVKSSQHRHKLEDGLHRVEVGFCLDRIVNTICDKNAFNPANDKPSNWEIKADEESGDNYYQNRVTGLTQWSSPECLHNASPNKQKANSNKSAEREDITAEINLKVNAVGEEALDRVEQLKIRQKESEDLFENYNFPGLLDKVNTLRHDLDETVDEIQTIKEGLQIQAGIELKVLHENKEEK